MFGPDKPPRQMWEHESDKSNGAADRHYDA